MAYEFMYNIASDLIQRRFQSGEYISSDDTVCVIYTATGKIYTGMSRMDNFGGQVNVIHAEIEAVRNMLAYGDSLIEAVLLMYVQQQCVIVPCNGCISHMLSINRQNSNAVVVNQGQVLHLSDFISYNTASQPPSDISLKVGGFDAPAADDPVAANAAESPMKSGMISQYGAGSESAKGELLKNRVKNIMQVTEDEPEEEEASKKRFGKIFGR